ncbi:hypothetical protein E3U55_10425 [Filobacillus milosensis]|uniref:DUF3139 domain-containing protein n=1 Tax=Filobacillus milosensis TaxID=94137 RepID=A0A4Y8IID0_9BACI|nr:hypothetical protein [Filobacillus milosensis]TFB19568.1 hypothetical protein E3U55_10425 [Filobacillus milosensis]
MKKRFIIAIGCLVLVVGGLLVYPYNIYHHFTAEKRVENFLFDPNVQNRVLGTDAEITNVQYLGNDIYELQTEEKSFLVTIKSDGSSQTMNVFEHRQRVTKMAGYKDGR